MKNVITILFLTFSLSSALACSCLRIGILKGQNTTDFVLTGKVVKVNKIISQEKITFDDRIVDYVRYEFIFEIKHIHKGKNEFDYLERITIITSGAGADCGNYFELNEKYLVYSYKEQFKVGWGLEDQKAEKEFMSTNLCTRTKRIGFFSFLEQFVLELT
ncbi:hypothetical protein [Flavobacterium sp.]|jgi:hypothetical protein|uniref:hypothetical protein n=1 Tax=Flavobacterium sp. TaxID=239 RepID=UPI0037C198D8